MEVPPPFDPTVLAHPDPEAILSGPPTPWSELPAPVQRDGPPWWMTEMIAVEPALSTRVLRRMGVVRRSSGVPGVPPKLEAPGRDSPAGRLAASIRSALEAGEPIVATGCGTSEHAAMAFAAILTDAIEWAGIRGAGQPGAIMARQAFEASLAHHRRCVIIGISHEGASAATLAALGAAAARSAKVAAVSVSRTAPIGAATSLVLDTGEIDRSWCHTIGYISPILAAVAVGAALTAQSSDADPGVVRSLLACGLEQAGQAEVIAAALGGCRELIVVASGVDLPAGRELALKVEEAAWLPATLRDTETFLHGHLPAMDASTGLVLILADRAGREARSARAQQALAAAARVGIRAAAILAADLDRTWSAFLAPAGRILVAEAPSLSAPAAALVGTAIPLQLLAERIARARGTNPDLIRRDQLAYREAAALGD